MRSALEFPPLAAALRLWLLVLAGGSLLVGCGKQNQTPGSNTDKAADQPFLAAMSSGRTYYEKGETARALEAFEKAVALQPGSTDARLNLANALLLSNRPAEALTNANAVVALDHNSAAAHYLVGCAELRQRKYAEAIKALQTSRNLEAFIPSVSFQLGRAHAELGQYEEAVNAFREVLQAEPEHLAAQYQLGQSLLRAGRRPEGEEALKLYQQTAAKKGAISNDPAFYERCKHTLARAAFILEEPTPAGIPVRLVDITEAALGPDRARFRGPFGIIDLHRDGTNSLFVTEPGAGFRLLANSNGTFHAVGEAIPGVAGNTYRRMLVADLQNDRFDDVLVLGESGSHLFKFATNAQISDLSRFSRMNTLQAVDGALVDLDFTGKLDLLALPPGGTGVRVMRNLGSLYFRDISATSGIPASITSISQLRIDDWNNDDLMDVFLARADAPPALFMKQRGGPLAPTNTPTAWPAGARIVTGDFNNDLRVDFVAATRDGIRLSFGVVTNAPVDLAAAAGETTGLWAVDIDNDGWLDLVAAQNRLRAWRNLGSAGFREITTDLGLDRLPAGEIASLSFADLDGDCDSEWVIDRGAAGLSILRNDGGNANKLIKLRMVGNRSNANGLGIRIEITSGGLRTSRTIASLPVEIGVGKHQKLESLVVRWFDLALNSSDVAVECRAPLAMVELQLPTGSCPYLYAWDGREYRFVTDLLGAAPLGLPVAEGRLIEADPHEYVVLGSPEQFPPKNGQFSLQVTEELREVLYLDHTELVAVDHPPGTEIHTTGKLVPGRPFPPHQLIGLTRPRAPISATRSDGLDLTDALAQVDGRRASPVQQRVPQLRGLVEPYSVTLDFGPIDTSRPQVLALNGWLRFGGGMANMGASHHPDLPFPFPTLEAEVPSGQWLPVQVSVGAPAGKTKSIVADLTGLLPAGTRRLRLSTAFEIHWDRIVLMDKVDQALLSVHRQKPARADLHWRGFSEFKDLSWDWPLTPDYARVSGTAKWRITPSGWCTRYGDVRELIEHEDNGLVLVNGGDELTLEFPESGFPSPATGTQRTLVYYSVGWDKDADFHVRQGWQIGPLPWHGMDDQAYGSQQRPRFPSDAMMEKYNTRWVGPLTLRR